METVAEHQMVSEIMTTNVVTVTQDHQLHDVKLLFQKHKVRHLPVVNAKKLIGIISLTDILRFSFGDMFKTPLDEDEQDGTLADIMTVKELMRTEIRTINVKDPIVKAAQIFKEEPYHALPVIDDNQQLVGIITTTDIITYFLERN